MTELRWPSTTVTCERRRSKRVTRWSPRVDTDHVADAYQSHHIDSLINYSSVHSYRSSHESSHNTCHSRCPPTHLAQRPLAPLNTCLSNHRYSTRKTPSSGFHNKSQFALAKVSTDETKYSQVVSKPAHCYSDGGAQHLGRASISGQVHYHQARTHRPPFTIRVQTPPETSTRRKARRPYTVSTSPSRQVFVEQRRLRRCSPQYLDRSTST